MLDLKLKEYLMTNVITKALEWANHFVGTLEEPKDSNRGKVIDEIQSSMGYKGVQYCALFAQYVYKRACSALNIPYPFPSTASSQTLFEWASKAKFAETDFSKLRSGDIIIWRKLKLWQGHVGIVKSVDFAKQSFTTIEGNTSSTEKGSQRDGGGIFERVRYMKKQDFTVDTFYLRGFINVRKVFNIDFLEVDIKKEIEKIDKLSTPRDLDSTAIT
jgi:hypothetical protein